QPLQSIQHDHRHRKVESGLGTRLLPGRGFSSKWKIQVCRLIDTKLGEPLILMVPEHPFGAGPNPENMDETLRQVGGLLLGSVPTIIFFLVLYGLYTLLVHRPLTRVLAERRALTQGAIEKARADVASAEARSTEYEQKLRDARLALFKAQEARRAKAAQARTDGLAE